MRILLTRPRADAEFTALKLAALGHVAIVSPLIEIAATRTPLPSRHYDAIVATSANALCAEVKALTGIPLYAVGERTREAAQRAHWNAEIVVGETAKALIGMLRDEPGTWERALYLAGRDRKADIEDAFAQLGLTLDVVEAYVAREVSALDGDAIRALRAQEIDAALHYSRRSAERFIAVMTDAELSDAMAALHHFALSPDVAAPLLAAGLRASIAHRPDEDHLLALLDTAVAR